MKSSVAMKISLFIKALVFAGASLLISPLTSANELDQLKFITESYPPYNFKEKGKLQGIAVDLLLAATQKSSSTLTASKIKVFPWPRAYNMAIMGPNVVLFSTTRTEDREAKFNWVGPIAPTRIVLLAKKSSGIVISTPADIKKYTVGAIPNDIGDQLVKKLGVTSSSIKHVAKAESLAKMLGAGRIKLWAYEENVARWFIKKGGLNNSEFETVYTLKESDLYYAFSKDIKKGTLELLQKSIEEVKASEEFNKIKADYL
jgi:polar amino acid transport system substrate-binding protein